MWQGTRSLGYPSIVTEFQDAPNGLNSSLQLTESQYGAVEMYGLVPGAHDPDPGSNVPKMAQAYWRDQVPVRPAMPARTRVWLPAEFQVRSSYGSSTPKTGSARLGYNYFHGNLISDGLYIATQAPVVRRVKIGNLSYTFDTRADLWIMARTRNVRGIVMLTDWDGEYVVPYIPLEAERVEYYAYPGGFPASDTDIAAGNRGAWQIRVSVVAQSRTINEKLGITVRDLEAHYAVRRAGVGGVLEVVEDDTPHNLRHILFTHWPDGGVPLDPADIVGLYATAMKELLRNTALEPTMVHCLAGHGRTGTLLTTTMSLRRHRPVGGDNLSTHLIKVFASLRQERNFLVQNQVQLVLAYVCYVLLLAAYQEVSTTVPLLDSVKRIHARLGAEPATCKLVCVNCLKSVPSQSALVRCTINGDVTNFCSRSCSGPYAQRNQMEEQPNK